MTFKQANQKLADVAKGKYRAIRYELTTFPDGEERVKVQLYVDGGGIHEASTWADAFEQMDPAKKKIDRREQPVGETA